MRTIAHSGSIRIEMLKKAQIFGVTVQIVTEKNQRIKVWDKSVSVQILKRKIHATLLHCLWRYWLAIGRQFSGWKRLYVASKLIVNLQRRPPLKLSMITVENQALKNIARAGFFRLANHSKVIPIGRLEKRIRVSLTPNGRVVANPDIYPPSTGMDDKAFNRDVS